MQELEPTTVVLADDHAIVREGIAALCAANGMRILGQVADGVAAVQMIEELRPDFAILDLHMPQITGVEAIRRLRSHQCPAKLMILSISREEGTVMEALRAGACGPCVPSEATGHPGISLGCPQFLFRRRGSWTIMYQPMLRGAGLYSPNRSSRGRKIRWPS